MFDRICVDNDIRHLLTAPYSPTTVPRDAHERLEGGLRRVEEAVRRAEDSQWRRSNPEALSRARGTVEQIRTAITAGRDLTYRSRSLVQRV
jgi:hypothetical protein